VIRARVNSQEEEEGAAVDMVAGVEVEAVEAAQHSPEPKATTCAKS